MISESFYWRRDLYRASVELRRKAKQQVWRGSSVAIMEIRLMIGSYSVRRLTDSVKLPKSFRGRMISGVELKPLSINRRRFRYTPPIDLVLASEMFDFTTAKQTNVPVHVFLNQVIHSHTLIFGLPDGLVPECFLLVASDRYRWTRLLGFWVHDIARLFEEAALTDQTAYHVVWSDAADDYEIDSDGDVGDLAEWGFASPAEIKEAQSRLLEVNDTRPSLVETLRLLDSEIEEYGDRQT